MLKIPWHFPLEFKREMYVLDFNIVHRNKAILLVQFENIYIYGKLLSSTTTELWSLSKNSTKSRNKST